MEESGFRQISKKIEIPSERSKCGEGSFRMRILDRSQNLNLDWTKGTQPSFSFVTKLSEKTFKCDFP